VAARLFWFEHKPKISEIRQLDPCSDRHRRHPPCIAAPWGGKSLAQQLALGAGDAVSLWAGCAVHRLRALCPHPAEARHCQNADLEHANATITGNTDQITTLQTGNEALLETLDSATLRRMSLQLQVREGVNG
jgi:hypothetical protein